MREARSRRRTYGCHSRTLHQVRSLAQSTLLMPFNKKRSGAAPGRYHQSLLGAISTGPTQLGLGGFWPNLVVAVGSEPAR
jgi:hypothetical protein